MIKLSYQLKSTIKLQLTCSDSCICFAAITQAEFVPRLFLNTWMSFSCRFLTVAESHLRLSAAESGVVSFHSHMNTLSPCRTFTAYKHHHAITDDHMLFKTYISNYFNNTVILIYHLYNWYWFIRFALQTIPFLNVCLLWNCTCKQCIVKRVWA